jgi:hypothetical protein
LSAGVNVIYYLQKKEGISLSLMLGRPIRYNSGVSTAHALFAITAVVNDGKEQPPHGIQSRYGRIAHCSRCGGEPFGQDLVRPVSDRLVDVSVLGSGQPATDP